MSATFDFAARLYFADWARLGPPALPGRTTRARENEAKVLRALGGWINEAGRCWPTIRTVATASGLAPTSCARAIKRLVDAGVLKARRRGRRVVYTVVHFQGVMDRIRRSRAVARAKLAARSVYKRFRSSTHGRRTPDSDSGESQRRSVDRSDPAPDRTPETRTGGLRTFAEGIADMRAKLTGEPPTALPASEPGPSPVPRRPSPASEGTAPNGDV